jgi:hypothetical protein
MFGENATAEQIGRIAYELVTWLENYRAVVPLPKERLSVL